jgi:hypothetical protein
MAGIGINLQGRLILKPSIIPVIDTSAMVPPGALPPGTPLMIGVSDGGDPTRIYSFSSYQEAELVLRNGKILNYMARAFNASPDKVQCPGPNLIKFIRASSAAKQGSAAIQADGGGGFG